ncbi:hypothetical protein QVE09_16270 [Paenibacillus sp. ClWae2A]|uniref:hypothetical protein n=1 Tax=Paenibacillus sp. ClWae2A TaxID=3057177 RepID=UPI0028F66C71|nr:hypothetical protein [Paenibacillus sp. ClWae2A]MDT9720475.1 hypothetical protein [Paenibacillus sp. ClWae2A]
MAKVIAPNKEYTGLSAGIPFANGVGETDNEHLLQWFEGKGYTVDRSEPDTDPQTDEIAKAAELEKKEADKRLKALRKKATDLGIEGAAEKDAATLEAEIEAAGK